MKCHYNSLQETCPTCGHPELCPVQYNSRINVPLVQEPPYIVRETFNIVDGIQLLPEGEEMIPSIEYAKRLQHSCGLGDTHLIWVGEIGFTIAHTSEERERAARSRMSNLLELCPVHIWLRYSDYPPVAVGWYTVDADREPYECKPLLHDIGDE